MPIGELEVSSFLPQPPSVRLWKLMLLYHQADEKLFTFEIDVITYGIFTISNITFPLSCELFR